ncbi:MAG: class I SAM-dependent methyltransferase [Syntrophales bacterium]|nr:class I SAM-dependent methyltransferase [Syntrophales bacterium]
MEKPPWTVYACTKCGLGILYPQPTEDELKKIYAEEYFEEQYGKQIEPDSQEMKKRLRQEQHRLRFFRSFKRRGHILDIGCGMGYFLLACRNAGYEVTGLDVSEDAARFCQNKLKITVLVGNITKIDLPDKQFDVITMWHTLEHTHDPRGYLKKAHKLLKDDGIIVIDVPNYEGTDAKIAKEKWKGWQLPFHLYHFTPGSILELLRQEGFVPLKTKNYLSEEWKERLMRLPLGFIYARPIARLFSGHSFAVLAKKNI